MAEAVELAEAKTEEERVVIEQQQDILFEVGYMVWRREGKEIYNPYAPKTASECPFGFEPI